MGLILDMKIKFNIEGEVDGKMATSLIALADTLLSGLLDSKAEVDEKAEVVVESDLTEINEVTEQEIVLQQSDSKVSSEQTMTCKQCDVSETPQWRYINEDFGPLCNACGVKHYKQKKRNFTGKEAAKADYFKPTCEFCSRKFSKAHHMTAHLKFCVKNPDNTKKSSYKANQRSNRRGEPPNPFKRVVVPSKEELEKKLAKRKPAYYDIPNESDLRVAVHNYICGNLGKIAKSDTLAKGLVAIAKNSDLKFRTMTDNVIRDLSNRIGQLMRELAEKLPADSSMLTTTNNGVNIVVLDANLSVDNLNELFV